MQMKFYLEFIQIFTPFLLGVRMTNVPIVHSYIIFSSSWVQMPTNRTSSERVFYLFPSWDFSECDKKRKEKCKIFSYDFLCQMSSTRVSYLEIQRYHHRRQFSIVRSMHSTSIYQCILCAFVVCLIQHSEWIENLIRLLLYVSTPCDRDSGRVWQCWEKVSKTASSPGTLTLCVGND